MLYYVLDSINWLAITRVNKDLFIGEWSKEFFFLSLRHVRSCSLLLKGI